MVHDARPTLLNTHIYPVNRIKTKIHVCIILCKYYAAAIQNTLISESRLISSSAYPYARRYNLDANIR